VLDQLLDRVIGERLERQREVIPLAAAPALSPVEELGPAIEPGSLAQLDVPQPEVTKRRIRACCLYVDRFGNMQLNLTREHLQQLGIEPGTRVELELGSERYYAIAARTYADARPGEIILYEDAYQNIAIAISAGSAAETFFAHPGVDVRIRVAD